MLKTLPQLGQLRRPVSRLNNTAGSMSISTTASIGWPSSARSASRASACATLRGYPSSMNPAAASGRPRRSRIRPRTISSDTSSPASIAALARLPSSVPRLTASRSRSPDDTCGMPFSSRSRWAWVPLPEPGAPSSTSRILEGPTGCRKSGTLPQNADILHRTGAPPFPASPVMISCMKTKPRNAFYAQSGGVTAVINASACGVIETARRHKTRIGRVYAGRHGIVGALTEDLIDTSRESTSTIRALRHTPGGAFGSARFKLKGLDKNKAEYERLIEVFRAHDIGYFFYNGGNDSMDTALKVSQIGEQMGYPITCVGVPKTVDNDLPHTDCCPGFGSVAKYIAVSTREAALDVASMARTSTKVFVLEVMGRHAGWIAAAGGLAGKQPNQPPHIILFPEIAFDKDEIG